MTTAPYVELGFHPTDLRPQDLPRAGAFLGSPAEATEAALAVTRTRMIERMKAETRVLPEVTAAQLLRIADLSWQGLFWSFRRISAPVMADAYLRAYRAADAGDVPMEVIYNLADKQAEKVGEYFHTTSREALAEGFNTLVNRRLPAKAAVDKVLDAYGLTPRQMRGYINAKQFEAPVNAPMPTTIKEKARAYIDRAFTTRTRTLSVQEEHNLDEQAKQLAWMWLQDKGRLNPKAQKMWITAHDEKVCPVCGPLNGKKVGINERFLTPQGEFWSPGLHPNCRCVVRLIENRFAKNAFGIIEKADPWDPKEHPRGGDPKNRGRFSQRPGTRVKEREPEPAILTQLAEELKQQSVIETTEEEPVVHMGQAAEGAVSMGGAVRLGGAVSMGQAAVSMKPTAVSMTAAAKPQAKVRMTPAEVEARIQMRVTPAMRVRMEQQLTTSLEQNAEQAKPRPKKLYYRPTLKIQDDAGHRYPVYAVVSPVDVPEGQGRMLLHHDIVFSPNFSEIARVAFETFDESINAVYDDIHYNESNIVEWTPTAEQRWTTTIDDDTVLDVVAWKAYQGRVTDSDWAGGDPMATLTWKDRSGGEWNQQHKYSEIAEMLRVSDEDFDFKILRLDEGHDSDLGTTSQISAGTKGGEEDWVTSGTYKLEPRTEEDIHHNLKMRIYNLEPEIEEQELTPPDISDFLG